MLSINTILANIFNDYSNLGHHFVEKIPDIQIPRMTDSFSKNPTDKLNKPIR
ncbi:hypothetical protein CYANOKiyG1_23820 [Okeania sp. KiyG1]|nr:hypothetical protein CYANOKiyG1_23820 [Okeania sp. KiyG1]